jgi:hypothetical protein
VWKAPFENLEPADLNDRICVIGFVHVAGQNTLLDTLYNVEAEVSCSGWVGNVLLELSDGLLAPSCTGVVEVHMRYGL